MVKDIFDPTDDFIFALEKGYRLIKCRTHPDAFDLKRILEYCNRKSPTDAVLLRYIDRANQLFKANGNTLYIFDQPYSKSVRDGLPVIINEFGRIEWYIK